MTRYLALAWCFQLLLFAAGVSYAPKTLAQSAGTDRAIVVAPSAASNRYALVIGNTAYRNAAALPNARNDAVAVAEALGKVGFEVTLSLDATGHEFREQVADLGKRLGPGDVSLFYFAGHGVQAAGENYLLPVDAEVRRPADLAFVAERLSDIVAAMTVEDTTAIVLLDACRNNPFERDLAKGQGTRDVRIGQGLASFQPGTGVYIAFATEPDNIAVDGGGPHSPFASALLRHMATPGIDIEILMRRVRSDVIGMTAGLQTPWSNSSLLEPGFAFVPAAVGPQPAAPASPSPEGAVEEKFWQSVKDTKDPAMLRAYLAAYPKGAYSQTARRLLTRLEAPAVRKKATKPAARPDPAPKAKVATRSAPEPGSTVKPSSELGTTREGPRRCRDGNIARCRQNCAAGRRGACSMLKKLGG